MKSILKILCALALLQVSPLSSRAASEYINYQGLLNGADGNPLPTGSYTMEFSIHTQATLDTRVWGPFLFDGNPGDGHGPLVPLANGRFNVVIGPLDTNSVAIQDAFDGNARFIEVRVNGGSPILPRQQFLSNPYAFRSSTATSLTALGSAVPAVTAEGPNISIAGSAQVGTTLNVAGDAHLSSDLRVDSGQISTLQTVAGLVSAGTVDAINMTATNITATNITAHGAINGEQPPYVIHMGTRGNTTDYHAKVVPSDIVEQYLGDEDGGTLRYILRVNNSDEVRSIVEFMAIEQPGQSEDRSVGLHGYTYQPDGTGIFFVLNNGNLYNVAPFPWDWIYLKNYQQRPLPGLPGTSSPAYTDYTLEFITVPNVSATIIIYDR